jgi:hypothetical protein
MEISTDLDPRRLELYIAAEIVFPIFFVNGRACIVLLDATTPRILTRCCNFSAAALNPQRKNTQTSLRNDSHESSHAHALQKRDAYGVEEAG